MAVGAYETHLLFRRGLAHLMFGGVFERFPELQFAFTETGAAWIAAELPALDGAVRDREDQGHDRVPALPPDGRGALHASLRSTSGRNCRVGISLAVDADIESRHQLGADRLMWGADYPHHEGSFPHTPLALRLLFSDVPEEDVRQMTSQSAAELYGFDLDALQVIADEIGPTVEEIATPVSPDELPPTSLGHTVSAAIARAAAAAA